jgi:hypothetical protein
MLTTAFDTLDIDLLHYGTVLLRLTDSKRGNSHRPIINDIIDFLDLVDIDPRLAYVSESADEQNH